MKYIKTFEKRIDDIYVLVDKNDETKINFFLKNTIGKIKSSLNDTVYVEYYGYLVPKDLEEYFIKTGWGSYIKMIREKDLIFESSDKKEVEVYLASKKYNIV